MKTEQEIQWQVQMLRTRLDILVKQTEGKAFNSTALPQWMDRARTEHTLSYLQWVLEQSPQAEKDEPMVVDPLAAAAACTGK